MSESADILSFKQALAGRSVHKAALEDALNDLGQRKLTAEEPEDTGKGDRRLLDQFVYRYIH